jgi:hypothetical protein
MPTEMTQLPEWPQDGVCPVDGRQSKAASAIARGASRCLLAHGFAKLPELTLANGRRADLVAIGTTGRIWIIEIKSSVADFRADQKWQDYRDYCDRYYFAVAPDFPIDILPADAGLIIADTYGGEIARHPVEHPLSGARRKEITLRFARAAALILHAIADPGLELEA